jgi:hypothetical protein
VSVRRLYPAPALETRTGRDGTLRAFLWRRRWHTVTRTVRTWRVDTEWWSADPAHRTYREVVTAAGLICVAYHDAVAGTWHLDSITD